MKNYAHPVIRIKKGKPNFSKVYWLIAILNKSKQSSQNIRHKLGFYLFGKAPVLSLRCRLLGNCLNKGILFNESAKKYLYFNHDVWVKNK